MLTLKQLTKVLFLDIETVSQKATFEELQAKTQQLWERKAQYLLADESIAQKYEQMAAIYAEFGQIICVSIGFIYLKNDKLYFKIKSFYHENEKILLKELAQLLEEKFKDWSLCAHNGKEFDYPYLCRRFLVNQIALPRVLDIQNKKPWEVQHLDTLELWKFGDKKAYTSLDLLCHVFDIPTPKDDIAGAEVGTIFWQQKDLPKIARYCEKDVLAVAQLLLRMNLLPTINPTHIGSDLQTFH